MAQTLADVQAGITTIQGTVGQLDTDIKALVAKSGVDLDPIVAALATLNTALVALDDAVKAAIGA